MSFIEKQTNYEYYKQAVKTDSGTWRSLVAHLTGGQGVAGSNPVVPTRKFIEPDLVLVRFFCFRKNRVYGKTGLIVIGKTNHQHAFVGAFWLYSTYRTNCGSNQDEKPIVPIKLYSDDAAKTCRIFVINS